MLFKVARKETKFMGNFCKNFFAKNCDKMQHLVTLDSQPTCNSLFSLSPTLFPIEFLSLLSSCFLSLSTSNASQDNRQKKDFLIK